MHQPTLEARVAKLHTLAILAAASGLPIPSPVGGREIVVGFPFNFTTPSQVFGPIVVGAAFMFAGVIVDVAFDAPATLRLGSSANLDLLLTPTDSRLQTIGQYQSDAIIVADAIDVLVLTMSPTGATVGSGYIFYRMLPP